MLQNFVADILRTNGLHWQQLRSSEEFFAGGLLGDFSKKFLGGPKVVKYVFAHTKLRKQSFLLKFSKSRRGKGPSCPLSDTHGNSPGIKLVLPSSKI